MARVCAIRSAEHLYPSLLGDYPDRAGTDDVIYYLAIEYERQGDVEQERSTLEMLLQMHPSLAHASEASTVLGR